MYHNFYAAVLKENIVQNQHHCYTHTHILKLSMYILRMNEQSSYSWKLLGLNKQKSNAQLNNFSEFNLVRFSMQRRKCLFV